MIRGSYNLVNFFISVELHHPVPLVAKNGFGEINLKSWQRMGFKDSTSNCCNQLAEAIGYQQLLILKANRGVVVSENILMSPQVIHKVYMPLYVI